MFTPILIVILGLTAHQAIPISKVKTFFFFFLISDFHQIFFLFLFLFSFLNNQKKWIKVTLSGVGLGSYLITHRLRHPKADRPLIDYDIVNIFEPSVLLGTIVGVYLNVTFPSYLIVITLFLTLTISAYNVLKKSISLYRQEYGIFILFLLLSLFLSLFLFLLIIDYYLFLFFDYFYFKKEKKMKVQGPF